MKKENKMEKKERVLLLVEKINLLFCFVMDLAKDKDLLEEVADLARKRESFSLSAAPILGAMGIDYEEKEREANIIKQRANAILNLISVLERTEKQIKEFKEEQAKVIKNRAVLEKILG